MKNLSNTEKIELIKNYLNEKTIILELSLINYENNNLYISLKKTEDKNYKLYWFNLDNIIDGNIEKYASSQYILKEDFKPIIEYLSECEDSSVCQDQSLGDDFKVCFKVYLKTKVDECVDISFRKYLSFEYRHLMKVIVFILRNMSKKYEELFFEIFAQITKTEERYEYKEEFTFDLFKGNIDKLFDYQICERGKDYYEKSKVKFLEKVDDNRYFAVVEGHEKYLVIIKYIKKKKIMQVYCSCPCEFYCKHMYAVILAIRNNKFNKLYRVVYRDPDDSLLNRIIHFKWFYCVGLNEDNIEIIDEYGEFETFPIIDDNNNVLWKVLEDSKDNKLSNGIKEIIKNIRNNNDR